MPVQVSTPNWKLLSHIFKEALEVETFFCLAPRTAPDLPIILSTRNSFIWSPYSPDGFQVPIIRSLTAPRSAGTCQAAVTGEDDQDFGKWCRYPLSQGHRRIFLRESVKNYLADFFPLRGGGIPPISAEGFWVGWFSVKGGRGVPPNSAEEKIL